MFKYLRQRNLFISKFRRNFVVVQKCCSTIVQFLLKGFHEDGGYFTENGRICDSYHNDSRLTDEIDENEGGIEDGCLEICDMDDGFLDSEDDDHFSAPLTRQERVSYWAFVIFRLWVFLCCNIW